MERLLWRLHNISPAPHSPERFEAGLRLHLEHADLLTVLVQIDEVQQAYVSAAGCAGCPRGRHAPGCHVELLRRLLTATFETVELLLVPLGLAHRSYTQVVYARPSKKSTPFDGGDLATWDQARIILHWRRGPQGLSTAAILAAGDGPDLAAFVQERGWTARPLSAGLGLRIANNPSPASVWFRGAWSGAPFLLTPQPQLVPVKQPVVTQAIGSPQP